MKETLVETEVVHQDQPAITVTKLGISQENALRRGKKEEIEEKEEEKGEAIEEAIEVTEEGVIDLAANAIIAIKKATLPVTALRKEKKEVIEAREEDGEVIVSEIMMFSALTAKSMDICQETALRVEYYFIQDVKEDVKEVVRDPVGSATIATKRATLPVRALKRGNREETARIERKPLSATAVTKLDTLLGSAPVTNHTNIDK